jgi:hypothetical protein
MMKTKCYKRLFVISMLVLGNLLCIDAHAQKSQQLTQPTTQVEFGVAHIVVKDKPLNVEFAHNFEQRARGLMYRDALCEDCGMLFEFDYARTAGFWMKNTFIPLDIAYIDGQGVIADIKPMYPLLLKSVSSSRDVLYALEMNQGWFEKQGIAVGDRIQIISRVMANQ